MKSVTYGHAKYMFFYTEDIPNKWNTRVKYTLDLVLKSNSRQISNQAGLRRGLRE